MIVTMVSDNRSMFEDGGFASDLPVIVRLADGKTIRRATVRSVDYDDAVKAPLSRDGDALTVTVPRHRTASIAALER